MKIILMTFTLLSFLPATSFAASLYYTFEGQITSIGDSAGRAAAAGLNVDDNVKYIFEVDRSLDGYDTRANGEVFTRTDLYYGNTIDLDYFYTDLISPHHMTSQRIATGNDIAEFNTSWDWPGIISYKKIGKLRGGSVYNEVSIFDFSPVSRWSIGGVKRYGDERAYNNNGDYSEISSELYLTDISSSPPISAVPLPASAWLLGSALLGLIGFQKNKRRNSTTDSIAT